MQTQAALHVVQKVQRVYRDFQAERQTLEAAARRNEALQAEAEARRSAADARAEEAQTARDAALTHLDKARDDASKAVHDAILDKATADAVACARAGGGGPGAFYDEGRTGHGEALGSEEHVTP